MSKSFTLLIGLVLFSLILSACAAPTGTPEVIKETVEVPVEVEVEKVVTATPLPAEPITLRFTTLSGPEFEEGYGAIVDQWNADHPEIQVQYETYPWGDYWVKIPAMYAASNAPDILWTSMGEVDATWVTRGLFAPLDEFIDGANSLDHSDWDPLIWEYGVYDDQVFLLNTIANLPALAYNKDAFDAVGLEYPDDTWTWDDVLEAAKKVTADVNGLHPEDPGFDSENVAMWGIQTRFWPVNWFPVLWSFGGRVYNEDKTSVMYDSPEDIEAMAWWGDLVQVHKVAPPYEYFGDAGWDMAFGNGMVAMHLLDSNSIASINTQFPDLNYGTTIMPTKEEGGDRYVYVFGRPFGISSASQHKEEAWLFLRYLASPENQAAYASGGWGLPASAAAQEMIFEGFDAETREIYQVYVDSMQYIFTEDRAPDFWTVVAMPLMDVLAGATTVIPGELPDYAQLMQDAADKANNILWSPAR
jgi:multiple sugar transport system substrate-binding protein